MVPTWRTEAGMDIDGHSTVCTESLDSGKDSYIKNPSRQQWLWLEQASLAEPGESLRNTPRLAAP